VQIGPRYLGLTFLLTFAVTLAGCDDDEPLARSSGTPTIAIPSATTTAPPTTVIPARTATSALTPTPAASAAPTATRTATAVGPRVDGTVDPLGFGGTEPETIKSNPDPAPGSATLANVRIGVHPEEGGWDRIVFEFKSHLPAGRVSYEASAVACGSGAPVSIPGNAVLLVSFTGTDAHDDAGRLTIPTTTLEGPGKTILQARQICDFEGHVTWALGISGKQQFKVTRLQNPTRVVIDIRQ
jgi:hypothetical protein